MKREAYRAHVHTTDRQREAFEHAYNWKYTNLESWISVLLLGATTILLRAKAAGRGTLPGMARGTGADRGIERSYGDIATALLKTSQNFRLEFVTKGGDFSGWSLTRQ